MRLSEPVILEQIDIFIKQNYQSCKSADPTNMSPRVRYLTLDVTCILAFGHNLQTQEDLNYRFVSDGIVTVYSILHNEKYFPEPFAYRPERWLSKTPEGQMKNMYAAFIPFSTGSRGCAGRAMAYLETRVVISKIFWPFDFEKAPGELGELGAGSSGGTYGRHRASEFQVYDVLSSTRDGPNLVFHPRIPAAQ